MGYYSRNFEPVHIISLEGFSDLAARDMVEKLEIKSPKDKNKIQEFKEKVYTLGFYIVKDAKDKVKEELIKSGEADIYFEPEGIVTNRLGEECVVALVDQWYLKYGEKEYKDFCLNHVKSNKFNAYSSSTLKAFEQVLGWLTNLGVSRTFGLGSHIPWDKNF